MNCKLQENIKRDFIDAFNSQKLNKEKLFDLAYQIENPNEGADGLMPPSAIYLKQSLQIGQENSDELMKIFLPKILEHGDIKYLSGTNLLNCITLSVNPSTTINSLVKVAHPDQIDELFEKYSPSISHESKVCTKIAGALASTEAKLDGFSQWAQDYGMKSNRALIDTTKANWMYAAPDDEGHFRCFIQRIKDDGLSLNDLHTKEIKFRQAYVPLAPGTDNVEHKRIALMTPVVMALLNGKPEFAKTLVLAGASLNGPQLIIENHSLSIHEIYEKEEQRNNANVKFTSTAPLDELLAIQNSLQARKIAESTIDEIRLSLK